VWLLEPEYRPPRLRKYEKAAPAAATWEVVAPAPAAPKSGVHKMQLLPVPNAK
jgi:hypothetical protein